jgi:hypothetical protein
MALVVALMLAIAPQVAAEKTPIIAKYKANAMAQGGPTGTSMVELQLYRWTTDEERGEILEVIKGATDGKMNNREVAKELRGQKKTGYVWFAGRQGYPLRYARKFDLGNGKTQIILATDRPVSFGEVYSGSVAGDWDVSLILLNLDNDGKGDGVLSIGTEVTWNKSTDKIEVSNMSSQPTKLTDVRRVDK